MDGLFVWVCGVGGGFGGGYCWGGDSVLMRLLYSRVVWVFFAQSGNLAIKKKRVLRKEGFQAISE